MTSSTTPSDRGTSDLPFEDALALAFLATSRWGAEIGYGDPIAAGLAWRRDAVPWYAIFFQSTYDHPTIQFGFALAKAIAALEPSVRGDFAEGADKLAAKIEAHAADEPAERLAALLTPLAEWRPNMTRHDRRWIAMRAGRVMLALLTRETRDGRRGREAASDDYALIRRALVGMGLDETDWVPSTPQDGRIRIEGLDWWKPRVVDLDSSHGAGATVLSPPDAHGENITLVAQPRHFDEATAWYQHHVLPFIEDRGGRRSEARLGIGPSTFVGDVPYSAQSDEVRWLLWALADAMLALTEARESSGRDVGPLTEQRLPLIRAIWSGEIGLAVDSTLGFGPGNPPPELGDPEYTDYAMRWADVLDKTEAAARRFLRLDATDATDDLSSLQIAMASRAARQTSAPRSAGCGATLVAAIVIGVLIGDLARRRWSSEA